MIVLSSFVETLYIQSVYFCAVVNTEMSPLWEK